MSDRNGAPARRGPRSDAVRNRERVSGAAFEVFSEDGLDATVADVGKRANLGNATVFRHFPSKPDLLNEVTRRWLAEWAEAINQRLTADPPDTLEDLLRALFERLRRDRFALDLLRAGHLQPGTEEARVEVERLFTVALQREIDVGRVRADVTYADLAVLVLGAAGRLAETGDTDPDRWNRHAAFVWAALRPKSTRSPTASEGGTVEEPEGLPSPQVIDAHVHVWELARRPQPWIDPVTMPVLDRDHSISELAAELADAAVTGAVLVQVLNDVDESEDYLWLAADAGLLGVVPWLDLLSPGVEARLAALFEHPSGARVLGIRHQALAETDPAGWLECAAAGPGLRILGEAGVAFDLMFRPEHLSAVHVAVRSHPGTMFVLDHAGKPPIADGWVSSRAAAWAEQVTRLSGLPNLVCKLSGLTTMADLAAWTEADLRPFVDHLLACFGPERLMFGSDWPVSLRAGDYRRTVSTAWSLVAALSLHEQQAVLAGTARRVYRLD